MRWLYNGVHSLDYAFWHDSVLWCVGMWIPLLGGLVTCTLMLLIGRVSRAALRWLL